MPCSTRKRLGRWAAFDVECRPPSEGPERLLGVVSVCSSSALAERVWERTSMRERGTRAPCARAPSPLRSPPP